MKPLLFFMLGTLAFNSPPTPPDSLISKVVIFKKGHDLNLGSSMAWGSPLATGFYLDTGNVKCAFVVTARHVVRTPDSVAGLRMHIVEASGRAYDEYLGDYRVSRGVMTHPDFWIDIALLGDQPHAKGKDTFSGFRVRDIVTREEFEGIGAGSRVFYIGMCLDSVGSPNNVYSFPEGSWLESFDPGKLIIDTARQFVWKADFSLIIPGTPGVSGSPVLMREDSSYRLVGIVNGFGVDESGKMVDIAYCTAAYRILEALADTTEGRWLSKEGERLLPPRG